MKKYIDGLNAIRVIEFNGSEHDVIVYTLEQHMVKKVLISGARRI